MAFHYVFVLSALLVVAQGSYLDLVDQESPEGIHSGGIGAGAPGVGIPQGRPVIGQPQRSVSGYGGSGRLAGSPVGGPRSHGAGSRLPIGGTVLNRPGIGSNNRSPVGNAGRSIGGGYGHRHGSH
ncbi:uncharacterized protein Dana_GF27566 [Drosophila ananassae]|uniref:Uncharacterized protein n=1 Tax=Drosophila ananassae TaxID=7217 RepID=A0A0P8YNS5_DROAN|nr:uncharacterized protein LOC26514975 [Drosophila ananassae]KPU80417.1 uncharacterized protein Dana_GF27566 [Drosophila ananassae]